MVELLSTQRIVTERSGEFYEDVGDYFIEGKWFYQMSPWEWNEVKKQLVQKQKAILGIGCQNLVGQS